MLGHFKYDWIFMTENGISLSNATKSLIRFMCLNHWILLSFYVIMLIRKVKSADEEEQLGFTISPTAPSLFSPQIVGFSKLSF